MNAVREWTAAICLAALVAALVQGLVPSGAMERMAKFVIGAFVLCILILPLSKVVPQWKQSFAASARQSDANSNSRLETTVDQQYEDAARRSITNLVVSELKPLNINCKNVQVNMDTNSNGSISITKVVVNLDQKNSADCQRAKTLLEKDLGLNVEVVCNGG
jgi:hypothetical protein